MANDAPTTDPVVDYRALLEEERTSLSHQLAELGFGDAGGLKYDPNFADSSQVTAERGEAGALAGELTEAARRGRGGHRPAGRRHLRPCERCGQPIAPARLEAMPAARRCIACASLP